MFGIFYKKEFLAMKKLSVDWLTSGLMDFEYKKYLLLAYLQEVRREFGEVKLYPALSDLVFHYQNLLNVKKNKTLLYEQFPQIISKADFERLTLEYEKIVKDDELMQVIEEIILFALPELKRVMKEGEDIYKYVEEHMVLSPVGIEPLRNEEGYLLLHFDGTEAVQVYLYQSTLFEPNEEYRTVRLNLLEEVEKRKTETYESVKVQLIKKYKDLPQPATFLIVAKVQCPLQETVVPIARRLLMKHLARWAA
jgi:hypothetical protein